MATTQTSNLGLRKIDKGEKVADWPTVQSSNMDAIDRAVSGKQDRLPAGSVVLVMRTDENGDTRPYWTEA